jgi:hypothetical protein
VNLRHRDLNGWLKVAAVALPIVLAARPVGDSRYALWGKPIPPPNAVDVWGEHTEGLDYDVAAARLASRELLNRLGPAGNPGKALATQGDDPDRPLALQVGGFSVVGNVAILAGDDATVGRVGTGFGMHATNMMAVSRRFIEAFGDDYDQIAVFLAFTDRMSVQSLAYQQPVKSDTKGIGLGLWDSSAMFGSRGRMQTMLNMKRISVYGRDAATDPDNGLYAVWAQEAGHRWLVYFRYQREGEPASSDALLGRQKAHWARTVQADGSIQDGYLWRQNPDGTFTPMERGVRYGALDQYGMGLRLAKDVPPFFLLENVTDLNDVPVMTAFSRTASYKARRIDLTVDDIIRAVGRREPEIDVAAQDLRMAVVLLSEPGVDTQKLIGEAFLIDNTRRLWTEFYNMAGGGRGKVCTNLYRPCRGDAYEFGTPRVVEDGRVPGKDGLAAPDELVTVEIDVTNVGDQPGKAKVQLSAGDALVFPPEPKETGTIAPGQMTTLKLPGRITRNASCGEELALDIRAPGGKGPSRTVTPVVVGLKAGPMESFDGPGLPAGWQVNADGMDTATQGRWEAGTPQRSLFYDYTLQPGAAFSGSGAVVTGVSANETDNVDGRTSLTSVPYAVKGLADPRLSYQVYFVSADFDPLAGKEVLVPAPAGSLVVQASLDGQTWTEVDRVTGMANGWQRRVVSLATSFGASLPTAETVRFRFVVEEAPNFPVVVEAVLDDVGLFSAAPSCAGAGPGVEPDAKYVAPAGDGGGGGCSFGGGSGAGAGAGASAATLLAALGLLSLMRRRRQRRAPAR